MIGRILYHSMYDHHKIITAKVYIRDTNCLTILPVSCDIVVVCCYVDIS